MRKTFLITALLLLTCFAFGQKKRSDLPSRPPAKADDQKAEQSFQCLHIDKYSAKERRSFSPFATAGKIKLISFKATGLPDPVYGNDGKLMEVVSENIDTVAVLTPFAPGKFVLNYRKIKEEKTLGTAGIDSLTDILYNVGYTPVKNLAFQMAEQGGCYNPRNAIVFFDTEGNVTQYIEVCFECKGYYYSSSKTKPIKYCKQKYDMLSAFFSSENIKYGTAGHVN
jgi:hypothetical protein